ncbi:MAG: DUF2130 domain-containing protein [Candidatus Brocadiia bacterium]|jgi:hypothetical protein
MAESEQTVVCPGCGKSIPLTKALTSNIEATLRRQFEAQASDRERALKRDYAEQLQEAQQEARAKAREGINEEMATLRDQLMQRDEQIAETRRKEMDLIQRERSLTDRLAEVDLEIARRLDTERSSIREEVARKMEDERQLKDLEKDKQLSDLKMQVDVLKRKLEQGSQQTQGEAVELQLEELLAGAFPFDQIEPVGKGIKGADVLQRVNTQQGQYCGMIAWEFKNTRNWTDGWIAKLKDDQRAAKAEIGVLATAVLPKGITHIGQVEGVWVTDFASLIGLASALRTGLVQVALGRLAAVGKNDKMDMLYNYLTGTEFKQRVEAMIESFILMRDDLEQEKRAAERVWAKREKQIQRVVGGVAGMYGDMQGIVGVSLPRIERLELPAPQ